MAGETPYLKLAAANDQPPRKGGVDSTGGGGDDGRMEQRIAALEAANLETRDRLIKIETRMEALASKEDLQKLRSELHESLNAQTWKIIGASATLCAVVFYLARFVVPHA